MNPRNAAIRTEREAGVPVKVLAAKYGISPTTISRVTKGCRRPETRKQRQARRKAERIQKVTDILSREIEMAKQEAHRVPLFRPLDDEVDRFINRGYSTWTDL